MIQQELIESKYEAIGIHVSNLFLKKTINEDLLSICIL